MMNDLISSSDEKRRKAGQPTPRRKPSLHPLPAPDARKSIDLTPWDVLHALANGLVLARHGTGRGLAEHWQSLKYSQALAAGRSGFVGLSDEGRMPERSYKAMQSKELSLGFGLLAAEQIIKKRYPDHVLSIVDASIALLAGWSLGGAERSKGSRPRPEYIIEAWKPGEPSKVTLVGCRGNHEVSSRRSGKNSTLARQLVSASEQAEGVHIGSWNNTPCLLFSTGLLSQGGVVINALQSPGTATLPIRTAGGPGSADERIEEVPHMYFNEVLIPAFDGGREMHVDGFQVPYNDLTWFGQVLARTSAAGLMAFAGGGRKTAQYLTKDQGNKHYDIATFAGSSSIHDASITVDGAKFVGTDHVFRLNTVRVEAFSGIAKDLYPLLADGGVEEYRRAVYNLRSEWKKIDAGKWRGPISFREDGTVMALRLLSTR